MKLGLGDNFARVVHNYWAKCSSIRGNAAALKCQEKEGQDFNSSFKVLI